MLPESLGVRDPDALAHLAAPAPHFLDVVVHAVLLLQADKSPVNTHSTLDLRTVPASGTDPSAPWIKCGLEPGAHGLDPRDFFA